MQTILKDLMREINEFKGKVENITDDMKNDM